MENEKRSISRQETVLLKNNQQICKDGIYCQEKDLSHFTYFYHIAPEETTNIQIESNQILNTDNVMLTKTYSEMNDCEKRYLVEFAQKCLSKSEKMHGLSLAKSQQLEELQHQLECNCISDDCLKLKQDVDTFEKINLTPNSKLTEDKSDLHFRLAESQFYRLIYGCDYRLNSTNLSMIYKVTSIDLITNNSLSIRFKQFQQDIINKRGSQYSKVVLGFHGTAEENIDNICRNGFYLPGDNEYKQKTDSGYYGKGIYFSQHPTYAMDYIKDCSSLLLCQVILGRVKVCEHICQGQMCDRNYDSHCSPNGRELIIFNVDQILPCYIVHFQVISPADCVIGDDQDTSSNSRVGFMRYNSRFDLVHHDQPLTKKRKSDRINLSGYNQSAKRSKSTGQFLFENLTFSINLSDNNAEQIEQIKTVIINNGGLINNEDYSILLTDRQNVSSLTDSIRLAKEKNVPCIPITCIMKAIEQQSSLLNFIHEFIM